MAYSRDPLSKEERRRFRDCPVRCRRIEDERVSSLSDYLAILSALLADEDQFWFRGHNNLAWELTPSGLRYRNLERRNRAIELLRDFRRVAEIKLARLPQPDEELKWLQLAQHYGIPTRLLDWTESATIALHFACLRPGKEDTDGMVFLVNPKHLSRLRRRKDKTSLDAHLEPTLIKGYFELDGRRGGAAGLPTVAIKPVWNSERLMVQRGVFTLHGSRQFSLDDAQAPSLVAIPIVREVKEKLRVELGRVGVDEMTVFPELEHACRHLKRDAGLEEAP
jgi:hypothetical protein